MTEENKQNDKGSVSSLSGDEYLKIVETIKPILESVKSSNSPKFVFITGGIGSGKTTIRRHEFSKDYINFDFAEIGKAIEKAFGEKHPRLMDYSFWACDMILGDSITNHKNIIIELIGDNADQITILATKMKELGYEVNVNGIICDVAEAYKRHKKATAEDKDYMSCYFSAELTLMSLYTHLGLGKVPINQSDTP